MQNFPRPHWRGLQRPPNPPDVDSLASLGRLNASLRSVFAPPDKRSWLRGCDKVITYFLVLTYFLDIQAAMNYFVHTPISLKKYTMK